MKQRFSSLDVKVIVHELSEALVTLRLANVYDLSSKILLLKFAKPNHKQQLLIDSGFRCHLTDFARTTAAAPSSFAIRLRKFLKTRRVTSVAQIGTDRIIEFQFSDGAYRLYLEFFASGNVILTDSELKILALLRNVPEGEGQEPQRVGLTYNLQNRQNVGGIPPLTKERVQKALTTVVERAAALESAGTKLKRKGDADLRRGLATTITELPPVLVDHVFRLTGFDSKLKPAEVLGNAELFDSLFHSLEKAREVIDGLTSSATSKGFIVAKPKAGTPAQENSDTPEDQRKNVLYEDFHPFLPKQFEDDGTYRILSFDGFNKTVDEFFSSVEGQKLESRLTEREAAAKRKLDAARQDQQKRIEGLQEVQLLNLRKAAAIEANVERVQEAMDAINGLLEQGMDWVDVTKLIEREKRLQNPVAEIIKLPLKLNENTITIIIGEEEEQADEDADFDFETDSEADDEVEEKPKSTEKRLEVDIKLNLSPWVNAREYYVEKRTAADKAQKTIQQTAVALENAERKIADDLKKGLKQEKPILQLIRKQMWFEKFTWFISSDGYLVLGGRDVQQNEMLYKRYLRKGDVYVHADLHGASSVIIKNNPKTPDAPIPPSTLTQAGHLSVCSSTAWDSKAGMPAWWVNADQVSKSAPTGEFLPAGSFMVRGKKNFLPPAQLMLGFGLIFRVSEESKAKHFKNRVYDHESLSTTGGASGGTTDDTKSTHESAKDPSEAGDSDGEGAEEPDDDDDDDDHSERANPLQSAGVGNHDIKDAPEDEEEPPSEKLANAKISGESPTGGDDVADDDQTEVPEEDDRDEEEPEGTSGAATPSTTAASQAFSQQRAPAKRGQRNKSKKAARYKDQDDEDRAIMESITGVAKGRERAQAEAAVKAQKEAEAAIALERRRQRQERTKKEIAEHEEIRRVMLEEGVEYLDAAESLETTPLDSLIGTPLVGDEILEAIPICAPWLAMGKIKYKAKLQPGNTKKGKAVKEIIERWRLAAGKKGVVDESASDNEKMWPREVELIKALKAEEAFNCVPVGKVTVMMAGGNASGGGGSSKGGQNKGGGRGGKGSKRK